MATIVSPPSTLPNGILANKVEAVVTEIQPVSDYDEADAAFMRKSKLPQFPTNPKRQTLPLAKLPPKETTPIFPLNGTTLENIEQNMLLNRWFVENVRDLIAEYKAVKLESEKQAKEIATLQREKETLSAQVDDLIDENKEIQLDYDNAVMQYNKTAAELKTVRLELAELQSHYGIAIVDLRNTKEFLAEALREVSALKLDIANKAARIADLEDKLRIANEAEDIANDHVVELQGRIYDLERAKAAIERRKDKEEQSARAARDLAQELETKVKELNREIRRLKRLVPIKTTSTSGTASQPVEDTADAGAIPPVANPPVPTAAPVPAQTQNKTDTAPPTSTTSTTVTANGVSAPTTNAKADVATAPSTTPQFVADQVNPAPVPPVTATSTPMQMANL